MRSDRHKQCLIQCRKCISILGPLSIFFIATAFPLLHLILLFLNLTSKGTLIVLIIEVIILSFCYFNLNHALFYASCSDPGSTKKALNDLSEPFSQEFIRNLPVCEKCGLPKPARAHHCNICNECHLRMDHHCPAIGNCVALNNHQSFLVMLIWAIISCLMLTIFCVICGIISTDTTRFISFVIGGASFLVAILLVFFLIDQLSRVYKNITTLEYLTQDAGNYDLGRKENVNQLFGTNYLRFVFPHKTELTGFEWELSNYRNASI